MPTRNSQRTIPFRVAVLLGGESEERAVSLASGAAVSAALARLDYAVTEIDPAKVSLESVDWSAYDAAFIALHGRFGEDGGVQEILERAKLPFTGSNSTASRLAFSKSASKERFIQRRVPTPPYVLVHVSDGTARIERVAMRLGYPLAVKPDRQGSSLGVTIVESPDQLTQALARCFSLDEFGLIERAVVGTEWTVGLFDELVLPPIQIVTPRGFFDYEAKYQDDATEYRFEFDVADHVVETVKAVAQRASRAIEARGLSRVDIRLDEMARPWVLEVNTIPGMTDHSLIPKAAARLGIGFESLCRQALESCLAQAGNSVQVSFAGHPDVPPPLGLFRRNSRNSEFMRRR